MIQLIRGFRDILPGDSELWRHVEKTACELFEAFGYKDIRIPVMEKTELFARSIGEDTDIVEKEMYSFADRRGDMLTLRPEATASIVRAYIQHKKYAGDPIYKVYTVGPMFRRERPQKGRYRQFYQIDVEVFGVASAYVDAQLIYMLDLLLKRLEVEDVRALVNSLGCPECRPGFRSTLIEFINQRSDSLCSDCLRRKDRNPLRVLDCKVPACREAVEGAPSILDHLCAECQDHFDTLRNALDAMAVDYRIDPRLVRGLDYYTRTAFEVQTGSLGAQSAVAGGGRYDALVKTLGGPDIPAIGFAIGFDRLVEIIAAQREQRQRTPALFIAALGPEARNHAFAWCSALCARDIPTEMEMSDRSLKSQMKRANRLGADFVLMVGENELLERTATLRDMQTQQQESISLDDIVSQLADRLAPASKSLPIK